MIHLEIQNFIYDLADNESQRAFNDKLDELSDIVERCDIDNYEESLIIQKFLKLPVVQDMLQGLIAGRLCPPYTREQLRGIVLYDGYKDKYEQFTEKVASDLGCLNRVLERLKEHNADDRSIAVVEGMIDGNLIYAGAE